MSVGAEKFRLFVALALPAEVRAGLSAAQEELRRLLPPRAASWTRPEHLHLTLRFLGDVSREQVEALTAGLTGTTAGFGTLALTAERLGAFPDARYPRVLWAGVQEATNRLAELQRCVTSATNDFTRQPMEARFTGHVTMARIRHIQRPQAETIGAFLHRAASRHFGSWTATHLDVMRSELLPDGSRYTQLATIQL
jgi:2'-5' RNA ligase